MTESEVYSKPKTVTSGSSKATVNRLFILDLSGGRVFSVNTDGSDLKTIVTECRHPDGIVVDVEADQIYWTDMGVPILNRITIIPQGGTFTPKQIYLDKKNGKLYWYDREGMRVMRSNLDGSSIETLVQTGHGATKWYVGITVDVIHGKYPINFHLAKYFVL
jgi:Low-density lipoprotein receptor repeat class B